MRLHFWENNDCVRATCSHPISTTAATTTGDSVQLNKYSLKSFQSFGARQSLVCPRGHILSHDVLRAAFAVALPSVFEARENPLDHRDSSLLGSALLDFCQGNELELATDSKHTLIAKQLNSGEETNLKSFGIALHLGSSM